MIVSDIGVDDFWVWSPKCSVFRERKSSIIIKRILMNPLRGAIQSFGSTLAKSLQTKPEAQKGQLNPKTVMTTGLDKAELSPEAKKLSRIAESGSKALENFKAGATYDNKTFSMASFRATTSPHASEGALNAARTYQANDRDNSSSLSLRLLLDQRVTDIQADHYKSLISGI